MRRLTSGELHQVYGGGVGHSKDDGKHGSKGHSKDHSKSHSKGR